MNKIDINKMIKREMRNNFLNATDLSRKLGVDSTTVLSMLKRPTLQVERLIDLSRVLNYNFFQEIAEQLPYKQPLIDNKEQEVHERLNDRIKELEMEVKILRNTLKDLVRK